MNRMNQRLDLLGTLCGVLGAASCILAGILRLARALEIADPKQIFVSPRGVLLCGIALMVFGCWLKLTAKKD
ncbi:MAG: hypothetical protein IH984_05820 [Planctomycetes bacterium]|nr:hypothetical protein [Planctomycetota bacterium]